MGKLSRRVTGGEDFSLAVIALVDVASKERRTASGNIPERPFAIGVQGVSILLAVRCTVKANDIGHLQHEDLLGFTGLS